MGIGRLLSYTDAGAPQLQGTVGSLAAVLKAALVDGYGSVAPLGWTLEYSADDYKTCVFRSNSVTGIGAYFKIMDTGGAKYAAFTVSEGMSDIDTQIAPVFGSGRYGWLVNGYTANNTPWHIVGEDRGFWMIVVHFISLPQFGYSTYIGEYIPAIPNAIAPLCVIIPPYRGDISAIISSYYYNEVWSPVSDAGNINTYLSRDYDGTILQKSFSSRTTPIGSSYYDRYGYGATYGVAPTGFGGGIYNDRNGVSLIARQGAIVESSYVYGYVPGLYDTYGYCSINSEPLAGFHDLRFIVDGNRTYVQFFGRHENISYNNASRLLIAAGEGFRYDI